MAETKTTPQAPAFQTAVPPQSPLEQYLEKNFRLIMVALALLAVVLSAWGIMRYLSNQTALEAAERFTAASSAEDCDVVIQKYPGSVAAGNALVRKAELLWNDGKKESSISALRQFVKEYGKHPLQVPSQLGLSSKLDAMGEKAEARQLLDGILKKYPQSEFAPAAQIQIADLLWEDGKADEAKKLLESLARLYPGKMVTLNEAVSQRLQLMNSGLPTKEIPAPPAPPKPATPPSAAPGAPTLPPGLTAPPQITLPPMIPPTGGAPAAPAAKLPTAPAAPTTPPTATPAPAPAPVIPPPPAPAKPETAAPAPVPPSSTPLAPKEKKPAAAVPAPGSLPIPPPPPPTKP